jgi:hypothetical protein
MTHNNSAVRPREFVSIIVVVIAAIGGTSVLLSARHGVLIWNEVFRDGWPILGTAMLVGVLNGWASWRLRKRLLARLLIALTHLGIMCLLAFALVKRLATADTWFGIWLAVFQTGVSGVAENLLGTPLLRPAKASDMNS